MAFTHFTNLTPLTVKVRLAGTGDVLATLKPCDEATVKTPRGLEFEITDELDCVVLSTGLAARSETQDLSITDDEARRKPLAASTSLTVKIVNTLSTAVGIYRVQADGKESFVVHLGPQEERYFDSLPAGAVFRVRGSANEKLDLIVVPLPKTPGEVSVLPIADRYELVRRLEAKDPSVRYGRYDVVKADLQAPDPADTKYIRYGHQNITHGEMNGWPRPLRRVTISGVDLVFDNSDRSRFLALYEGAEDVAELWIHADTLTVKCELRFPGANVYIYCRALLFEGADAVIDTTPIDKTFRDPASIDGADGDKGGDFIVYTSYFRTDQKSAKHFRARGGRGQAPDEGGVELSSTVRNLECITEEKWNAFFTYENRRLPHEAVLWDKWGYFSVMPFPDFKEYTAKTPNIGYIEISNSHYLDNCHIGVSGSEVLHTWGTKEQPGKGGKGKPAGKPGVGGRGGQFTCSLEQIQPYTELAGGQSGTPLPPTAGGAGGTPSAVHWLFFEARPDGANQVVGSRAELKVAQAGEKSEAGPLPSAPSGTAGQFQLINPKALAWISPINISLAIQYARDACASGHADYAAGVLSPYIAALGNQPLDPEFEQPFREGRELLRLSTHNVDFFGKPPGWVPTLSLQSAAGIYDALLPQAMNELYASYYIERIARSKQDKQQALQNFSRLLNSSNDTAKDELVDLRKDLPKAMADLEQMIVEIDDVAKKTKERQKILRDRADQETVSEEQKEAAAAAFRIVGAVIKAIPLPEPYQTAAGAFGSVFDITGSFIDQGGSDAAFENLKTQVTAFTSEKETLTDYLNAAHDASFDVSGLEKEAAAGRKVKEALEEKYGGQAKALDTLKEKRKEVYEAKKEALIYSRATTAKERARIVKRAETLTASYQEDVQKLEATTSQKIKDYEAAKSKVNSIEAEISSKKADFEKEEKERDKKKAANAKTVKTRMQQLQNVAASVASIASTMNKLAVSKTQLNSKFDQALTKLKQQDQEFANLAERIKFLNEKKETIAKRIAQLTADITNRTDTIAKNMLALNEIAGQMATNNESLDANALVYIQSTGQDAHATLTRFLYYSVKAYEYYMVMPWAQSYVTAQKCFDDLRRVIEPSTFKLDAITDPQGDKQKSIEAILAAADPRKAGMLSAEEFDLLKVVYQKPLLDMGKQLASELMESNGTALKETQSTITLTADWLADLNDRVQSPDKQEQVLFNLIDLRHIGRSIEKQRISNIRVIDVQAIKRGQRFPDTIKFVFEHLGKSIVRSRGHLFAFEPQSTAKDARDRFEGSGVTFETQGGKRAAQPAGWAETTVAGRPVGRLGATSLWQPDRTPQENLLSKLLKNSATLSLSQFRPGAFSDFLLKVDINPPECKVEFTEIVLEVSYEGGYASRDELLICVNNNAGLEIPVTTDVKDISGRRGAIGRYVGVFNSRQMAAAGQRTVRVNVPFEYGRYLLKSWEVNGEPVKSSNGYYDAAKDAFIVVSYVQRTDTSGGHGVTDVAPGSLAVLAGAETT